MSTTLRWTSSMMAAALLMAGAARANAQKSRIEFGGDAAITHVSIDTPLGSSSATVFDFPVQSLRAGFQLTPILSIEPALGLRSVSGGGSSSTQINFDIGVPVSLSGALDPAVTQAFVRPLVGFRHASVSSSIQGQSLDQSETQTAFGIGLGMRIPITTRFAWRLEARYTHALKKDNTLPATNEFGLLAGVSFFTR